MTSLIDSPKQGMTNIFSFKDNAFFSRKGENVARNLAFEFVFEALLILLFWPKSFAIRSILFFIQIAFGNVTPSSFDFGVSEVFFLFEMMLDE
jgi:hypothetical protein